MDPKFSLTLAILIVAFSGVLGTTNDENVVSPCPSKFKYSFRSPPLGLLSFTLNEVVDEVEVKVEFSIPGSGNKIGRLQFISEKDVRLKNGEVQRKLKYKIRFPEVPFLPRLTLLKVNGEIRCRGPPYKTPEYSGIETIVREDTFIHGGDDDDDDEVPVRRTTIKPSHKKKPPKKEESIEEEEDVDEDVEVDDVPTRKPTKKKPTKKKPVKDDSDVEDEEIEDDDEAEPVKTTKQKPSSKKPAKKGSEEEVEDDDDEDVADEEKK